MLKARDALSPGRIDRPRLPATPSRHTTPAQTHTLWYALHFPALTAPTLINELASVCQLASAHIRISQPDVLVMEVRSMLRYFGGFSRLKTKLIPVLYAKLDELQQARIFFEALSPSADASALLARTELQGHIHHQDALKSALGQVPVSSLPLGGRTLHRLQSCGLLYLRDIWRLPSSALRLRFGRELSQYIELLLAKRPSALERWQPALIFCEDISVDMEISNRPDILWLASQLLQRMEVFLKKRQLGTDQLVFSLYRHRQMITHIILGVRTPTSDKALWLLLLENRLEQISLHGAMTAINLKVLHFYPVHASGACPARSKAAHAPSSGLLELLASRLGDNQIFQLSCQQSHDPAIAGEYLVFSKTAQSTPDALPVRVPGFGYWKQLPCWLLQKPHALASYQGKPVYLTPLEIVHGPQRIESCWWTGCDMRRDYYVVCNRHGMMLWIYRDLGQGKKHGNGRSDWFLHGLFA